MKVFTALETDGICSIHWGVLVMPRKTGNHPVLSISLFSCYPHMTACAGHALGTVGHLPALSLAWAPALVRVFSWVVYICFFILDLGERGYLGPRPNPWRDKSEWLLTASLLQTNLLFLNTDGIFFSVHNSRFEYVIVFTLLSSFHPTPFLDPS